MKIRSHIAAAFLLTTCFAAASAETPLPPVQVTGGALTGTTSNDVNHFFGIPYAAAPTGDNRWRAPQLPTPWTGVRQAVAFGPACRQTVNWIKEPQSEDCLSLNIWAPTKPGKYPVMVWIHGGGFVGGSGAQMGADAGNALVANGVILVTLNYRLGVFGFFAHPDLSAEADRSSGNQGILDQVAALKWIKANIAAFGGDPECVTVFGQSAGGGAVAALTMTPTAAGLFQRAIAQSGTTDTIPDLATAEKRGSDFTAKLGAAHVADLRKMDADTLLKQAWHPEVTTSPAISGDMAHSYAAGQHNPVPILTGWNGDEGKDLAQDALGTPITAAKYQALLNGFFGPSAATVLSMYPGRTDAEAETSAYRLGTDLAGLAAYRWADQQLKAKAPPAYVYYFIHRPAAPTTPCTYGCNAGHGAEIPFAFDMLGLDPRAWTADDKVIADRMIRYWTNFAKTGNPNGDGLPNWPAFDGTPAGVRVIGTDAEIKERGTFPDFSPLLTLGHR